MADVAVAAVASALSSSHDARGRASLLACALPLAVSRHARERHARWGGKHALEVVWGALYADVGDARARVSEASRRVRAMRRLATVSCDASVMEAAAASEKSAAEADLSGLLARSCAFVSTMLAACLTEEAGAETAPAAADGWASMHLHQNLGDLLRYASALPSSAASAVTVTALPQHVPRGAPVAETAAAAYLGARLARLDGGAPQHKLALCAAAAGCRALRACHLARSVAAAAPVMDEGLREELRVLLREAAMTTQSLDMSPAIRRLASVGWAVLRDDSWLAVGTSAVEAVVRTEANAAGLAGGFRAPTLASCAVSATRLVSSAVAGTTAMLPSTGAPLDAQAALSLPLLPLRRASLAWILERALALCAALDAASDEATPAAASAAASVPRLAHALARDVRRLLRAQDELSAAAGEAAAAVACDTNVAQLAARGDAAAAVAASAADPGQAVASPMWIVRIFALLLCQLHTCARRAAAVRSRVGGSCAAGAGDAGGGVAAAQARDSHVLASISVLVVLRALATHAAHVARGDRVGRSDGLIGSSDGDRGNGAKVRASGGAVAKKKKRAMYSGDSYGSRGGCDRLGGAPAAPILSEAVIASRRRLGQALLPMVAAARWLSATGDAADCLRGCTHPPGSGAASAAAVAAADAAVADADANVVMGEVGEPTVSRDAACSGPDPVADMHASGDIDGALRTARRLALAALAALANALSACDHLPSCADAGSPPPPLLLPEELEIEGLANVAPSPGLAALFSASSCVSPLAAMLAPASAGSGSASEAAAAVAGLLTALARGEVAAAAGDAEPLCCDALALPLLARATHLLPTVALTTAGNDAASVLTPLRAARFVDGLRVFMAQSGVGDLVLAAASSKVTAGAAESRRPPCALYCDVGGVFHPLALGAGGLIAVGSAMASQLLQSSRARATSLHASLTSCGTSRRLACAPSKPLILPPSRLAATAAASSAAPVVHDAACRTSAGSGMRRDRARCSVGGSGIRGSAARQNETSAGGGAPTDVPLHPLAWEPAAAALDSAWQPPASYGDDSVVNEAAAVSAVGWSHWGLSTNTLAGSLNVVAEATLRPELQLAQLRAQSLAQREAHEQVVPPPATGHDEPCAAHDLAAAVPASRRLLTPKSLVAAATMRAAAAATIPEVISATSAAACAQSAAAGAYTGGGTLPSLAELPPF